MLSDLQLVYMVPRNSTELLKINTTKFQVEREPVYIEPYILKKCLIFMTLSYQNIVTLTPVTFYLNYFSCHINLKYRVLTIPVLFFWSWFNIMIISRNFSMMHYDICYHSLMIAEHIMLKLTMAACIG